MAYRPVKRRAILSGLAGMAGGSALATLLRPLMAYAQAGAAPQRLLVIHRPCGTTLGVGHDDWWWPTGGVTGWKASPLISSFTDGKIASLQDKMVVLQHLSAPRNMNWVGDKHGSGFLAMLTPPPKDAGNNAYLISPEAPPGERSDPNNKRISPLGASADQLFLTKIAALQGRPVPSVQLTASAESVDQTNNWHCVKVVSYKDGVAGGQPQPLWATAGPDIAFKNYFSQATMGMTQDQIAHATALKKSVLDFASGGLTNLQSQVPKSQLPKLQSHLDAIRQLELSLASSSAMSGCMPPTTPMGGWVQSTPDNHSSQNPGAGSNFDVVTNNRETYPIWQQHKQIIKTLFQCDITRVISYTFGYGNNAIRFSETFPLYNLKYSDPSGKPFVSNSGHHDVSHGGGGGDAATGQYCIDKYYCDMTAQLLAELDSIKDVDGNTVLDNTLVVFWNEVSCGGNHGAVDMPVLLFGGKFLKMQGGSFLTLKPPGGAATAQKPNGSYAKPDAPYMSDFWVTAAQAWGYNLPAFGDPMWNTGMLSGIFA